MLIGRPLSEDDAMHVTSGQGLEINPSGEDSGDITQVAGIEEYDPIEQCPIEQWLYCIVSYCIMLLNVAFHYRRLAPQTKLKTLFPSMTG